jgi:hypothetical protein
MTHIKGRVAVDGTAGDYNQTSSDGTQETPPSKMCNFQRDNWGFSLCLHKQYSIKIIYEEMESFCLKGGQSFPALISNIEYNFQREQARISSQ